MDIFICSKCILSSRIFGDFSTAGLPCVKLYEIFEIPDVGPGWLEAVISLETVLTTVSVDQN